MPVCEFCSKQISNDKNLKIHQKTDKCKKKQIALKETDKL